LQNQDYEKTVSELENKMNDFRSKWVELLKENIDYKHKLSVIKAADSQRRLGSFSITPSCNFYWSGGEEYQEIQNDLSGIDSKIKGKVNPQNKSLLQTIHKQKEEKLDDFERQRIEYIFLQKNLKDQEISEYKRGLELNQKFILTELIGKGGFSEVWQCYDKMTGNMHAIKIQKMNKSWVDQAKNAFIAHIARGVQILDQNEHQNIIKFFEYFYPDDNSVALVMEYCSNGNLAQLIQLRARFQKRKQSPFYFKF
jgi:tousled-like kinase